VSKAAPLTASVVIKKGQAAPPVGAQGRAPAPAARSAHAASAAASRSAGTGPEADRPSVADLRPLSFKVPPEFDDRFRRLAFERRMKLNELLYAALDAYEAASKN
jgi:hypothetical protein